MTAAGRGREERRGGSAPAPRSSPLCAHPLPKPATPVPVPQGGPWTPEIPWLLAPARILRTPAPESALRRQGAPCELPIPATRRPLPRPRWGREGGAGGHAGPEP